LDGPIAFTGSKKINGTTYLRAVPIVIDDLLKKAEADRAAKKEK
jgi:hypothetical protein